MEIKPKFGIGDKVEGKYDDEYDMHNGVGEIVEVIVSIRYKVGFKGNKAHRYSEEDLKAAK